MVSLLLLAKLARDDCALVAKTPSRAHIIINAHPGLLRTSGTDCLACHIISAWSVHVILKMSQFNVLLSFCPTPRQKSPKKATGGCLNPLYCSTTTNPPAHFKPHQNVIAVQASTPPELPSNRQTDASPQPKCERIAAPPPYVRRSIIDAEGSTFVDADNMISRVEWFQRVVGLK